MNNNNNNVFEYKEIKHQIRVLKITIKIYAIVEVIIITFYINNSTATVAATVVSH